VEVTVIEEVLFPVPPGLAYDVSTPDEELLLDEELLELEELLLLLWDCDNELLEELLELELEELDEIELDRLVLSLDELLELD